MLPLLHVPMDIAQQASFQAHVEERVRVGNDVNVEETELQPQIRYDLIARNGQDHFVAIYNPRLVLQNTFNRPSFDPNVVSPATLNLNDPNDHPFNFLHNGGLDLEIQRPRYRISIYEFAAYGPITTTSILINAPWTGDGLPPDPTPVIPSVVAARFTLLFSQTQITIPIRLTRRIALIPTLAYNAFGGADSGSRGIIAFTSGPGASVALEVAATRDDRLTTLLGGGEVSTAFEGDRVGATILRGELTQAWKHYFNRNYSFEALGGATVGGDSINGYQLFSEASAGFLYDSFPFFRQDPGAAPQGGPAGRGDRLQVGLLAKATPWIDIFSGELEQRAVGVAAVNYTTGHITFRDQISGGVVFNTPRSVAQYKVLELDSSVRYAFAQTFSMDGGVRFSYQNFDNAIRFNQLTQATFFVGLVYAPLPARF